MFWNRLLAWVWLLPAGMPLLAQTPADRVVTLWAGRQTNPPALTLNWLASGHPPETNLVQRKAFLSTGWTTLATITNPSITSFADTNTVPGVGYEYKVTRWNTLGPGWGFL